MMTITKVLNKFLVYVASLVDDVKAVVPMSFCKQKTTVVANVS